VIRNCRITENKAYERAPGVTVLFDSKTTLINCIIDNTHASRAFQGGGFPNIGAEGALTALPGSDVLLVNCTITDNTGGFEVCFSEASRVINSIIREHFDGVDLKISHSNIMGPTDGVGNINADPLFVNPSVGDFRLRVHSPCIDSGTTVDLGVDITGSSRPVDVIGVGRDGPGAYDMGAYEFQLPLGDLDSNGRIDSRDLFLFRRQWMIQSESD